MEGRTLLKNDKKEKRKKKGFMVVTCSCWLRLGLELFFFKERRVVTTLFTAQVGQIRRKKPSDHNKQLL